ncbi:MAG: DUF5677 domain-containing protein [Planctomycetota bacterium]|nr:DUF5677 domain-containing protein [Planctomycetota bacterium]
MKKVYIPELADRFEVMLAAARRMIQDRDHHECANSKDQLRFQYGGAMLFRSLNLGECIVWAVRQGYGETVAIVARVLTEMAYNLAEAGEDFAGFKDYSLHSTQKHRVWLEKLAACELDEKKKAELNGAVCEHKTLLNGQNYRWASKIREMACNAKMQDNYLRDYCAFSEQIHTSTRTLDYYASETERSIVVNPRISPEMSEMYFVMAVNQWIEVVSRLFLGIPLGESQEFKLAFESYGQLIEQAIKERAHEADGGAH